MIGSLSYEDVMNVATQVGSNVRASLFYMADLRPTMSRTPTTW